MAPPLLLGIFALVAAPDTGGGAAISLNGSRAIPIGTGNWIDPIEDYPARARRFQQDGGLVVARLFVNPAGRVTGCLILQHARVPMFDLSTCRHLLRRARFRPFGERGLATYDYRIVWDLGRLPPVRQPNLVTYVH